MVNMRSGLVLPGGDCVVDNVYSRVSMAYTPGICLRVGISYKCI